MFKTLKNLWLLKDLRKKILVTTVILLIVRAIDQIPLPGIQTNQLQEFFSSNQLLGLLDIFSGGSLSRFSVGFMGVGPYITASIIMQLLTYIHHSRNFRRKASLEKIKLINIPAC